MSKRWQLTRLLVLIGFIPLLIACADSSMEAGQASGGEDLVFGDDFSPDSNGSWLLETDESGSTVIQDGRLVVDVSQPGTLQYSALEEPSLADFDLAVEAELLNGDRDATYGLLFRMASSQEFYRFELTGDGRYVIERHDADGTWHRLVDGWQQSSAIMTEPGAVNQLRVTAVGPALTFYVNDTLLQELQDSRYAAGKLALDAGTFSDERTIAAFDNLTIREP